MIEKDGRERVYDFSLLLPNLGPEETWMIGMLLEVGERMYDQVEHLPSSILNTTPDRTYLSPARVVLHAVGTDFRFLNIMIAGLASPDYSKYLEKTKSEDLTEMETNTIDAIECLRNHLAFRRKSIIENCIVPDFLNRKVIHPNFSTQRALVGHLIWHWTFHSGHIGAVTLELGYEYNWKSKSIKML